MPDCLHCGRQFTPRKAGHVFCSNACRHKGESNPGTGVDWNREKVAALFDPGRDPDERVNLDDWHPTPQHTGFVELDLVDTVKARRQQYRHLRGHHGLSR
jgi:hypothetical protein